VPADWIDAEAAAKRAHRRVWDSRRLEAVAQSWAEYWEDVRERPDSFGERWRQVTGRGDQ